MRMAFVCLVIVIVICAGASPACKAQTTAPATDATSQESTSVDHSSAAGQDKKSQGISPGPPEPTVTTAPTSILVCSSALPRIRCSYGRFPAI
jgi:hypothetical protein